MRSSRLFLVALVLACGVGAYVVSIRSTARQPSVEEHNQAQPEDTPQVASTQGGRRVTGRVVDQDGRPVAGAIIGFQAESSIPHRGFARSHGEEGSPLLPVRTDASGRFACDCIDPEVGTGRMAAFAEGYVGEWRWLPVLQSPHDKTEVGLVAYATGRVSGTVRTYAGKPVANAIVNWSYGWNATRRFALMQDLAPVRTDATGRYTMDGLPAGADYFSATEDIDGAKAIYVRTPPLRSGEVRKGVDFVPEPDPRFSVRLVSAEGTPYESEVVALVPHGKADLVRVSGHGLIEKTDVDGRARWHRDQPGPYDLIHLTPTGIQTLREKFTMPCDELSIVIDRPTWTWLTLKVVDVAGHPLPLLHGVVEYEASGLMALPCFETEFSGHRGTADVRFRGPPPFRIRVLGAGEFEPGERSVGGDTLVIDSVPDNDDPITLQLEGTRRLRGRVTDHVGNLVPGVRVSVCDDDGEWKWEPLSLNKDGRFFFSATDRRTESRRLQVDAPPGYMEVPERYIWRWDSSEFTIRLVPAGTLKGRVVAEGIERAKERRLVRVTWKSWDVDPHSQANEEIVSIDAEGRFVATRVPLDRPLQVQVDGKIAQTLGYLPSAPVTARAGDKGVTLPVATGRTLRGTIEGTAVPTSALEVSARSLHDDKYAEGTIHDDGTFAIAGLRESRYQLTLVHRTADAEVTLAQRIVEDVSSPVRFEIGTLGRIALVLDGRSLNKVTAWRADASQLPPTVIDTLGEEPSSIAGLRTDRAYHVVATDYLDNVAVASNVRPGETATLRFTPGVRVLGSLYPDRDLGRRRLIARNTLCAFDIRVQDTKFEVFLAPGVYDFVLIDGAQREQVLARDVDAATTGFLELTLP